MLKKSVCLSSHLPREYFLSSLTNFQIFFFPLIVLVQCTRGLLGGEVWPPLLSQPISEPEVFCRKCCRRRGHCPTISPEEHFFSSSDPRISCCRELIAEYRCQSSVILGLPENDNVGDKESLIDTNQLLWKLRMFDIRHKRLYKEKVL